MNAKQQATPVPSDGDNHPDRRRERRRFVHGSVHLAVDQPAPRHVEARLLDVSGGGFRATHNCSFLEPGLEVRFQHREGQGIARVIWNRIVVERVETGFFVLEDGSNS